MTEQGTIKDKRITILCFIAHYLPGYRSGGPLRSIANFVDHLGDEFDIRIVTRDRDVHDIASYPGVDVDAWNVVGNAKVFYASKKTLNLLGMTRLLRKTPYDVLYLNSYFAFSLTGYALLVRKLGLVPKRPCVISPRGEFSSGAMALKRRKKQLYIYLTSFIGIYNDLLWQASSGFEATDIRHVVGNNANKIFVASDLFQKLPTNENISGQKHGRAWGPLRIIFLSRISPMKNLDFLLRSLRGVTQHVEFVIYGPVEDKDYWAICKKLIAQLPENVRVKYMGEINPDQVLRAFGKYDLFVLPTRGENYGHVIAESLTAGTPVLISDQTPWQADDAGGITTLELGDSLRWAEEINRWAILDNNSLFMLRKAAKNIAKITSTNNELIEQNKKLFLSALAQ